MLRLFVISGGMSAAVSPHLRTDRDVDTGSIYKVHTKREVRSREEEGKRRVTGRRGGGSMTAGLTHKCTFKILFVFILYI